MWLYAHLRRMMNWLSLYIITPLQKQATPKRQATKNPVYDPAEEEFRRRMQKKKK